MKKKLTPQEQNIWQDSAKVSKSHQNSHEKLSKPFKNTTDNKILAKFLNKWESKSEFNKNYKNVESIHNHITLCFENKILTHETEKLKERVQKKYWGKLNEAPKEAIIVNECSLLN